MVRQSSNIVSSARVQALQWIMVQAAVVLLVALIWLFKSPHYAPTIYFAYRFFVHVATPNIKRVLWSFYSGELIKLSLSVLLLWVMLTQLNADILPLICGFLAAHLGLWVMPYWMMRQRQRVNP